MTNKYKMKVIVLSPDRISSPTGGIGSSFRELHKRLKNDVDFYVVGYPDPNSPIKQYRSTKTSFSIQHGGINGLICHSLYIMEALKFDIIPDIVHAHDWSVYFAAVELADYFKVPLVVTMQTSPKALMQHGLLMCNDTTSVDGSYLQLAHLTLEQYGLEKATRIISVSKVFTKLFSKHNHKIITIPHGVDLSDWSKPDEIKLPGSRKFKIVYVGRIDLVKGIDAILDAEIPSNVDVIVAGNHSEIKELYRRTYKKELYTKEGLHYIDRVYGQEYVNLLSAADAIIMPSRHEPFGIVGMEALASKSIVISSRVDGLAEYLDWNNSIHTEVTPEGIGNAYKKFLIMTDVEKKQMIKCGLKTCLDYDWKNIAKMYMKVYKSVINK